MVLILFFGGRRISGGFRRFFFVYNKRLTLAVNNKMASLEVRVRVKMREIGRIN